jgi:hypothetical protein
MTTEGTETPTVQPILKDAQARLLRATLALYAAQAAVDDAAAEVDRAASKAFTDIIAARLRLNTAEIRLRESEQKRKDVIARIKRDDAERDGRPWLRVAGTRAA